MDHARLRNEPLALIVRLAGQSDVTSSRDCLENAIRTASETTGQVPSRQAIFPNLGSMAVEGHADFLATLLNDANIAGVSLKNPSKNLEPIRPVKKRLPKAKDWKAAPPPPRRS